MKAYGIGKARRVARWLRQPFTRQALVLLYHSVAEVRSDPWSLRVTPEHFGEHLEILRRYGQPMRLQQLAHALQEGNCPRRALIVTFDDGYADNLHNAHPLLERYDIPATVFVTTGQIGHDSEFWWDDLDRLLLQPGALPETLDLSILGEVYHWKLGEVAYFSEEAARHHRGWTAYKEDTPSPRHMLYRSLWRLLHPLPESERRQALDELRAWAGAGPLGRATHRSLSREEVFALAHGGLVEVGAHTVTHTALSTLSAASQRDEIQRSKICLEEVLGHAVTSFAYPYGGRADYTAETVSIVREAGYTCACSNFAGVIQRDSDRFQLPRFYVEDCDGEVFARRLSRWFES